MAIPTSRSKNKAEIIINKDLCKGCGLCVSVCKDFSLKIVDKKVEISENPMFGCIGCAHCMAICPSGAIEIHGRELSPNDLFLLSENNFNATYDQMLLLMQHRRSIREFKQKEVEPEIIEKILSAAKTAPMGYLLLMLMC